MVQKLKYRNAPIQEAICEVHFGAANPITSGQIETLKPIWSTEYPDQRFAEEKRIEFNIGGPDGVKSAETNLGNRLICKSKDGKKLVQLSQILLAVNHLKPYPGWEESFRDTILSRWKDVQKSLDSPTFTRIGLRYINKIDIPACPLMWEKWFQFKLPTPTFKGAQTSGIQMQFQTSFPEGLRLITNIVGLAASGGTSSIILDNDMIWERSGENVPKLPEILERLHSPLGSAFESYLTDKVRALFR